MKTASKHPSVSPHFAGWRAWAASLIFRFSVLCGVAALLCGSTLQAQSQMVLEQPAGIPLTSNRVYFDTNNFPVPDDVPPDLPALTDIALGQGVALGLTVDGTVVAWGVYSFSPPPGLTGVRSIAVGPDLFTAVKYDGTLVLWPEDYVVVPPGLGPVKQAAITTSGTVVALKSDGTLATFGLNEVFVPAGVHDVVSIATGFGFISAVKGDGSLENWGDTFDPHPRIFSEEFARQEGKYFDKVTRLFPASSDTRTAVYGELRSGRVFSQIQDIVEEIRVGIVENPRVVDLAWYSLGSGGGQLGILADGNVFTPTIPSINGMYQGLAVSACLDYGMALRGSIVAFGEQALGTPGAVKTFTIKNTGLDPLLIFSVEVTGTAAADFTVNTAGMPGSVPPGSQANFTVTFQPSATGDRATTLRVMSTDPVDYRMQVILTGKGGSPDVSVTGNGVEIPNGDQYPSLADHTEFANANRTNGTSVRTYTLANSGTAPLTILAGDIYCSDSSSKDFAVGGIALPANIAPGGSTTFTVTFNPSYRGLLSTSVVIRSNDSHDSLYTFKIRGLSVPEVSLEQPAGVPLLSNRVLQWGNEGLHRLPAGLTGVRAVSVGGTTVVALKYDGTVVSEQLNPLGSQAPPLADARIIKAGPGWAMALRTDGTVAAWGGFGFTPPPPAALTGVKAISAFYSNGLVVKIDGTVVVWGTAPPPPAGLTGVKDAAVGHQFVVALKDDGTVTVWGNNDYGQLNVPPGLSGVKAVTAGLFHCLALKNDGTVVAWGGNGGGQTDVPAGLTDVRAISEGLLMSYALKNDGTIASWGFPDSSADIYFGLSGVQDARQGQLSAGLRSSTVDFSGQAVGSASVSKTFTLKNTGSAPLNISGVTVQDAEAADFTMNTAGMLTTLPPFTGQTTFSVSFTPGSGGERFTTLRVATDAPDDPDTTDNPFVVVLTGTGLTREISVSGNGVDIAAGDTTASTADHTDFGPVSTASGSVVRTFTIGNSGNAGLTLPTGAISLLGLNAADFTLGGLTLPASVAAGASSTFTITFDPSVSGVRTASVNIVNDDLDENPFNFSIQGTGLSSLEVWRQTYFGDPANSGNGADAFDFDRDGIANLLEYVFGLNPTQPSILPPPQSSGGNLFYSFTLPIGVSGFTLGAESSTTLLPNSWISVPDTGIAPQHLFSIPVIGEKNFIRLNVTVP